MHQCLARVGAATSGVRSQTSTDLFGHQPSPSAYPDRPGSREKGAASEDAAKQTAPLANARRAELYAKFLETGDHGLTADEAIEAIKGDARAYQRRISELIRMGILVKTPQRRPTALGSTATVIKIHPQGSDGRQSEWRLMNRPLKPNTVAGALETELPLGGPPLAADAATDPAASQVEDDFEFDWYRDDCIVLREQPATAIYVNNTGSLVIRQEKTWDRDEDTFVYLRPEFAINFAKYLLKVAGHGEVEFCKRAGGGFVDLR